MANTYLYTECETCEGTGRIKEEDKGDESLCPECDGKGMWLVAINPEV
ncbi:MAG: hypothetical protein ACOCQR_03350 [bacterium]